MSQAAIPTLNDGSQRPPALRIFMCMGTVDTLPATSAGPRGGLVDKLTALRDAGFAGIQGAHPDLCRDLGLGCAGAVRYDRPSEVAPSVRTLKAEGYVCATAHVGWGHESDAEIDALVGEIIAASAGEGLPIYIETHRATITQDTWRTVELIRRHPGVRFNADLSHWYTGLELPYGDLEAKWAFLDPVFARTRFLHGRMGNSSHIQVPLADPSMATATLHFREMWTRTLVGFLRTAGPGDYVVFAPELLHPGINYARTRLDAAGRHVEESDRWLDSLAYLPIIRACFAEAQRRCRPG